MTAPTPEGLEGFIEALAALLLAEDERQRAAAPAATEAPQGVEEAA